MFRVKMLGPCIMEYNLQSWMFPKMPQPNNLDRFFLSLSKSYIPFTLQKCLLYTLQLQNVYKSPLHIRSKYVQFSFSQSVTAHRYCASYLHSMTIVRPPYYLSVFLHVEPFARRSNTCHGNDNNMQTCYDNLIYLSVERHRYLASCTYNYSTTTRLVEPYTNPRQLIQDGGSTSLTSQKFGHMQIA